MGATSMVRGGGVTRYLQPAGLCKETWSSYAGDTCRFGDVEFEFLDDIVGDMSSLAKSATTSRDECHHNDQMELDEDDHVHDDDDDDDSSKDNNSAHNAEENRTFWDNQHQLLQANLCRTSSVESRIRNAAKEAVADMKSSETVCSCSRQMAASSSCRNCLMREVSSRLQSAGFNSAICRTKWRSTPNIQSGEHSFVDVIDSTSSKKGDVRVIIEVNFRAEFEMARASEDYNRLVQRLPEVFVGKVERLSNIIKVLCMAAKRCMKENKMHIGPWRKHKYMQAKWLGPCDRNTSTNSLSMGYSQRMPKPKPKASMLTVDLLDKIPNMHCAAVKVA